MVENSVGIITAICPHVGYEKTADIAKKAINSNESVRSLILKENIMDEEELSRILDPIHMTEPGISGYMPQSFRTLGFCIYYTGKILSDIVRRENG